MLFPCSVAQATIWHEAAKALHRAMWKNSLEERLQKVTESDDLIYLPRTEVNSLKLRELGCDVDTILIREEYPLVLKRLEDRRTNAVGGVVVTGQPGTGTRLLQKDMGQFAHVLITCREIHIPVLFASPSP